MVVLELDNQEIESIYLEKFHSNKDKFFDFIKQSYEKFSEYNEMDEQDMLKAQEKSMIRTWDSVMDRGWDEL